MTLAVDEILRIARLARLRLEPEEVDGLGVQLARILDYSKGIDAVDVAAVEATTHAAKGVCPLREDRVEPSLQAGEVLRASAHAENEQFGVPRFLG